MNTCSSCGASIKWIKTSSGKMMPVNAARVPFRRDPRGGSYVYNMTGELMKGFILQPPVDPDRTIYGYVSHFATCPYAQQHRNRG